MANLLHKKLTLGPPSNRELTCTSRSSSELLDVLNQRPEISQYVGEITLTNHGPLYTWLDRSATHWLESDESLEILFPLLPKLHRLAFVGCDGWEFGYNRFVYKGFSTSVRLAIDTVYPRLTSLKLIYVAGLPIDIFYYLPPTLKEFILHGPSWDFSSFPRLPPSFASVKSANLKACQLERLCLEVQNIDAAMMIASVTDEHYGAGITQLRDLHLDFMEETDHRFSKRILDYVRKTLRNLEFTPANLVVTGSTPEDIEFNMLEKLESFRVTLPIIIFDVPEIFEHMADTVNWLVEDALGRLSLGSSKATMKTLHLNLLIGFREVEMEDELEDEEIVMGMLDIDQGFSSWSALDRLMGEDNRFPDLERVIVDLHLSPAIEETYMVSFAEALRQNLPILKKRKLLTIRQTPKESKCIMESEQSVTMAHC
ncbi:hypothetical protein D9756_008215 [Leucocoprinus leucothites]|uniref:Uncharacterized protein n=1 Tax=Leucocoprinus leucothites TaxID=201217 RepID=A0A8H5CZT9_9AGAR|nr:hypothetical protein D9756_008215 [Leucoagaricus leucothites]